MPKINPRIKSIDDLLGLDAAEESPIEPTPSVSLPTKNTIITLPPQAIRAFRGHPFRLYEGDRLNDLVESISEHGVLSMKCWPVITGRTPQPLQTVNFPVSSRKIFPMKMPGFM